MIDTLYKERPFARFFVLETIARVPYFGEAVVGSLWSQGSDSPMPVPRGSPSAC